MSTGLVRTQYWNVSGPNPTPRTGLTSKAESRTDVEGYLLASDDARNSAFHGSGIAAGLQVSATVGAAGVTIAPGTALDMTGRIVVLAAGGTAIVDPLVGPSGVQNIPTVPVTAAGVTVDTTGLTGALLVTLTWREVEEATAGLLVLRQAPWLRLVDPVTYVDDGLQLVLAAVSLDSSGLVDALEVGPRRLSGSLAGRLEFRLPTGDPATALPVGQVPTVELMPRTDGGLDINLLSNGPARRALSVVGSAADVELGAGLRVSGATALASGLTVSGGVEAIGDVTTAGNLTVGGDLAVAANVAMDGDLAVSGTATVQGGADVGGPVHLRSNLGVDGNLSAGQGVLDGLAVHSDAVIGAGANGALTTRHVNGKRVNDDGPDGLFLNWNNAQTVHVGGAQPADLEVSRNVIVSGQVGVKTSAPAFDVHVNGTVCAVTFCNPSDVRLKSAVVDLVDVVDRLAQVRAVTFTPRGSDVGAPARRQAGVLAQEVVDVFPELVIPMGPDGLMAVDYAGLAGVLVGAVNELGTASAALASRIDDLEHRGNGNDDVHRG